MAAACFNTIEKGIIDKMISDIVTTMTAIMVLKFVRNVII